MMSDLPADILAYISTFNVSRTRMREVCSNWRKNLPRVSEEEAYSRICEMRVIPPNKFNPEKAIFHGSARTIEWVRSRLRLKRREYMRLLIENAKPEIFIPLDALITYIEKCIEFDESAYIARAIARLNDFEIMKELAFYALAFARIEIFDEFYEHALRCGFNLSGEIIDQSYQFLQIASYDEIVYIHERGLIFDFDPRDLDDDTLEWLRECGY